MSDLNLQSVPREYVAGEFTAFGGWKPPWNESVSAALALAIAASVALCLALEAPRTGGILERLL